MNITARLIQGAPEVDRWAQVTDAADLTGYPALEGQLHLMDEGRMLAWLVEMDTKYAVSEPVMAAYARPGTVAARFWMPEAHYDMLAEHFSDEVALPTDLEITLPTEGEWSLRVLGGRYDHLVVLTRRD